MCFWQLVLCRLTLNTVKQAQRIFANPLARLIIFVIATICNYLWICFSLCFCSSATFHHMDWLQSTHHWLKSIWWKMTKCICNFAQMIAGIKQSKNISTQPSSWVYVCSPSLTDRLLANTIYSSLHSINTFLIMTDTRYSSASMTYIFLHTKSYFPHRSSCYSCCGSFAREIIRWEFVHNLRYS